jgi:hypothetical protein
MKKIICMSGLIILLVLGGCVTKPKYLDPEWRPGTIAVLPFTNESADVSVERFARALMFRTLSQRKYRLVELEEIDFQLNELGITEAGQLPTVTLEELKQKINADSFMFGNIIKAKRVMLGIYFEKTFKAEFKIVDGYSGTTVWEDERESSESEFVLYPESFIETAAAEFAMELTSDVIMKALDSHPLIEHMNAVVQTSVSTIPKP